MQAVRGLAIAVTSVRTERLTICETEARSTTSNPADLGRRITNHEGKGGDIGHDYRARANECITTYIYAATDRTIGAKRRAASYYRGFVVLTPGDLATRRSYVRKDHTGSAEDVVVEFHAIVDANVVLKAHTKAEPRSTSNEAALAQYTVLADHCPCHDVAEVPNLRAATDFGARVTDCSGMDHNLAPKGFNRSSCLVAETPPA